MFNLFLSRLIVLLIDLWNKATFDLCCQVVTPCVVIHTCTSDSLMSCSQSWDYHDCTTSWFLYSQGLGIQGLGQRYACCCISISVYDRRFYRRYSQINWDWTRMFLKLWGGAILLWLSLFINILCFLGSTVPVATSDAFLRCLWIFNPIYYKYEDFTID